MTIQNQKRLDDDDDVGNCCCVVENSDTDTTMLSSSASFSSYSSSSSSSSFLSSSSSSLTNDKDYYSSNSSNRSDEEEEKKQDLESIGCADDQWDSLKALLQKEDRYYHPYKNDAATSSSSSSSPSSSSSSSSSASSSSSSMLTTFRNKISPWVETVVRKVNQWSLDSCNNESTNDHGSHNNVVRRVHHHRTVETILSCLDRYVDAIMLQSPSSSQGTTVITAERYRLMALTCVYTCLKVSSSSASTSTCCLSVECVSTKLGQNAYSVTEILDCERHMLQSLRWRIHPPTVMEFVHEHIQRRNCDDDDEDDAMMLTKTSTMMTNQTQNQRQYQHVLQELCLLQLETIGHDRRRHYHHDNEDVHDNEREEENDSDSYHRHHHRPSLLALAAFYNAMAVIRPSSTSTFTVKQKLPQLQRYLYQQLYRQHSDHPLLRRRRREYENDHVVVVVVENDSVTSDTMTKDGSRVRSIHHKNEPFPKDVAATTAATKGHSSNDNINNDNHRVASIASSSPRTTAIDMEGV